jgi:hypothetical protein
MYSHTVHKFFTKNINFTARGRKFGSDSSIFLLHTRRCHIWFDVSLELQKNFLQPNFVDAEVIENICKIFLKLQNFGEHL